MHEEGRFLSQAHDEFYSKSTMHGGSRSYPVWEMQMCGGERQDRTPGGAVCEAMRGSEGLGAGGGMIRFLVSPIKAAAGWGNGVGIRKLASALGSDMGGQCREPTFHV